MNAARAVSISADLSWEQSFLDWFSRRSDAAVFEYRRELGGFHYHQFVSRLHVSDGRVCGAFGRSQDRMNAAVKCAAEYVERKVMLEYFSSYSRDLPCEVRTSNGWAVHRSEELATGAAMREALERHLLLKSYLAMGWRGFKVFEVIGTPEIKLHFLTAAHRTQEHVAGLVAAQSPRYPGVSFGYCLGRADDLSGSQFWESGLYEAIDRILMLDGGRIDLSHDPQSWILKASKEFLEEPFDPACLLNGRDQASIFESPGPLEIEVLDLGEWWRLDFPLFAAYARGTNVIPLFPPTELRDEARTYLQAVLDANGIRGCHFPMRHPIL